MSQQRPLQQQTRREPAPCGLLPSRRPCWRRRPEEKRPGGTRQTSRVRSPGQIVSVVLHRDAHLWNWVIYDSGGVWKGYLAGIRLDAPVEDAIARLADHVARHWGGHDLPGTWQVAGENSWRAGNLPPAAVVDDADDWPQSPSHDWPSVFRGGDVVRLDDGRLAVVVGILDCAPEPPPNWELIVEMIGYSGHLDDSIWPPSRCRPAPEAVDEARGQGLLRSPKPPT
jgi:hypothetical protein